MCGIAGEMCWKGGKPSGADWGRIAGLMERRGPDDEGIWSSPEESCTFAFRRLAILDLSPSGHQPMLSEDGRYALVFNGEIYNFRELRSRLEASGHTFRSSGDSEVVLRALMEWGADALERFNGMFALAFHDREEHRLLIARDHAGIKPLYYLETPEGVAFASQYDQILAHPWRNDLPVSREALALYLRLAYVPAPFAILQGSHMLEPGCWREYRGDGSVRQGTHYRFPVHPSPSLRGEEAYEAVDAAVTAAVERQLVSDVPVAAFLSGGIDSPLVTAKMRTITGNSIEAFTIGTGDDASDESADAAQYARELGVKQVIEHASPEQALEMLDDVMTACSEPFGDYSIFPTMLVSRLAARDYKVILSGDGGDELFWGYTKRATQLIGEAPGFRFPHWLRTLHWGAKRLGLGNASHVHKRYSTVGHWQREKHTHLKEASLQAIFPDLPIWPADFSLFNYDGWQRDAVAGWLRWNELHSHLPMVLLKVDRASMFHSLEVRVPLLDREVISVAARVDWRACLDLEQGMGKIPLRRSLCRHTSYQTSGKRGFSVPMDQWLRGALRPIFEECLLERNELLGLGLDRSALRRIFDSHLKGERNLAWGLWPLLSLALWERRHFR